MVARSTVVEIVRFVWWIVAIVWLVGRFRTKPVAVRQHWASSILYFGLLIVSLLLLFDWTPIGDVRVARHQTDPEALGILGVGAAIALWSRLALARNWSGSVVLKEQHELIVTGPYRLVRHPMYTGLLLMFAGTALVRGTIQAIVGLAIFLTIHLWKMRAEEQLLSRHFPDSYPEYKARTKALIPYVF